MKIRHQLPLIFLILAFLQPVAFAQSSRWVEIGPQAGTIQQIKPHRGIPGTVFVINNEHLYRSSDSGKHWRLIALEKVVDVQIHLQTGWIFAVTQLPPAQDYYPNRSVIHISKDNGKTFKIVSQLDFQVDHLRIHPEKVNIMFGWSDAVYKSVDQGIHWDQVDKFPPVGYYRDVYPNVYDILFSPLEPDIVYLSGTAEVDHAFRNDIILESRNVGRSWKVVLRNFRGSDPLLFHNDPAFPNQVLATANRGIFKLTKNGWIRISDFSAGRLITDPFRKDHLFSIQSTNCDPSTYESFDGGRSWMPVTNEDIPFISSLSLLSDAKKTILGGSQIAGIYRKEVDGEFKESSAGMKESRARLVATDAFGSRPLSLLYADSEYWWCDYSSLYMKKNLGRKWLRLQPSTPNPYNFIADISVGLAHPSRFYMVAHDDTGRNVYFSFDAGRTWTMSQLESHYSYPAFLTQDPNQPDTLYTGGDHPLKSSDGGRSFKTVPLDPKQFKALGVVRVVIDRNDSNTLYFLYSWRGIIRSRDGGLSFQLVGGNSPGDGWSMTQLPGQDSFLLLTKRGRIFRTRDAGEHWTQVSKLRGEELYYTSSSAIYSADREGKHFFVTIGDQYLYESIDGGKNWKDITEEFGKDAKVFEITDPRDGKFFVATSRGVFQYQQ